MRRRRRQYRALRRVCTTKRVEHTALKEFEHTALPAQSENSATIEAGPATPRRALFAGLLLVLLLAALDQTIVSTALPTIVVQLGGLEHIAWVVTAYVLAQTIVTPLYGKLGDLYGRKRMLQIAVVVFLVGSALCGISRDMLQLLLFRALQGVGGGGLMVTAQAAVGDFVGPRERARYQGIFGAVFGLASIAGPLLGGFFTTHLSWRWIFYINLPFGAAALVVIGKFLPSRVARVRHAVDYAGASLLAIMLGSLMLTVHMGGNAHPWTSPLILGSAVTAVLAAVLLVIVERKAPEPVLPLHLFRNRVFAVTSAIALIIGFAMFGAITYLPVYLQMVGGRSPTASGLQLLPMMAGMLLTATLSGQRISRSGRYRRYPIAGTLLLSVGLYLLSHLGPSASPWTFSFDMVILGIGLGMVMQVLIVIVQNAVEYEDLGAATAAAVLFRSIGGSLGSAVLGALFSGTLVRLLGTSVTLPRAELASLQPGQRAAYASAVSASIDFIFAVAAGIAVLSFILSWFVEERPLREIVGAARLRAGSE